MAATVWANVILSTRSSLLSWEYELDNLCGFSQRNSISNLYNYDIAFALTGLAGIDINSMVNAYVMCSDGVYYPITIVDKVTVSIPVEVRDLKLGYIGFKIRLRCTYEAREYYVDIEHDLTEGVGHILYGLAVITRIADPTAIPPIASYTITLNSHTVWEYISDGGDWNDKISNAKTIVGLDIEKLLRSYGVVVDEYNGKILLDVVANPANFNIASDYKTLQLIYEDLCEGSLSAETFRKKADSYRVRYNAEIQEAWKRINIDYLASGNVDVYHANLTGELER